LPPLALRVRVPLQVLLGRDAARCRWLSTSTPVFAAQHSARGGGDGSGTDDAARGKKQGARGEERILWVKKEGDPVFAKLLTSAADVGDLTKAIVKELGMTQRNSTLALHIANNSKGTLTGDALDSADTLEEALSAIKGKIQIVVKATGGTVAPAAADGESAVRLRACVTTRVRRCCEAMLARALFHLRVMQLSSLRLQAPRWRACGLRFRTPKR
jgi:hypothetical protein